MIAALFVQSGGVYYGIPDVDCYDRDRNALTYHGPWPIVAHPPCGSWGRYWVRSGAFKGDDFGTFNHALRCVRAFGGVLEHPSTSGAFRAFGINYPTSARWEVGGDRIGWVARVEQGHYGHRAEKPTILYAVRCNLPVFVDGPAVHATLSVERMGRAERLRTPIPFRDLLIGMARSAILNTRSDDPTSQVEGVQNA